MGSIGDGGGRDGHGGVRRDVLRSILAFALAGAGPRAGAQATSGPGTSGPARARTVTLPLAADLAADAADALRRRVPVALFFDRDNCPYCEQALREYLVPMSRAEPWRGDAIFRQVEIDEARPLVDFGGTPGTHRDLAARLGVSLSPTLVVVGAKGEPLAPPVVGLSTPDFYAAYLDRALEAGRAAMRAGR
jgi:hypothetical protein